MVHCVSSFAAPMRLQGYDNKSHPLLPILKYCTVQVPTVEISAKRSINNGPIGYAITPSVSL